VSRVRAAESRLDFVADELIRWQARGRVAVVGAIDPRLASALRERGGVPLAALPPPPARVAVLVCAADLPLADGAALFAAAVPQADRLLLLVTPEDERAPEGGALPLDDEWVRWLSGEGFGRDFESTFPPQPGALFLSRHEQAFADLVGRYERRLQRLEREVVVLRHVAGEYGHELLLREQALDRVYARLDSPESVAAEAASPELAELMRHFADVRRRFAPSTSVRLRAFDWAVARLTEAERLILGGFDARDRLLARGRRLAGRLGRGPR
jgi:hypothetical protein